MMDFINNHEFNEGFNQRPVMKKSRSNTCNERSNEHLDNNIALIGS